MPLLDFFRSRKTAPAPQTDHAKYTLEQWLYDVRPTDAGLGVSPTQLTEIEKGHADWAYACVQAIADRIATLEWKIMRGDREAEGHPAGVLLKNPNHFQSGMEFLHATVSQLLLCGNAYWFAWWDGGRQPAEIVPLSPSLMCLAVDEINWRCTYSWNGQTLKPEDLLHLRLPNPASVWVGASPIEAAAHAHDVSLYSQIYQKNFFKNNARPDFVVILPPAQVADRTGAQRVWDIISDRHKGLDNAHKPLVLGNGASITTLGVGDADRRYLEASNATRDKILSIFRVPAAKLGLTTDANRANADAADYTFNRDTIGPKIKLIADYISGFISRLFREDIRLEFDSPVASDSAEERAQEAHEIEMGLATRNEIRERHGLPPVEGGDVYYLRQGIIPVEMAGASIQAAIDMREALAARPEPEPQEPKEPGEPESEGDRPTPEQPQEAPKNLQVCGGHPRLFTFRQLVKAASLSREIPLDIHAEVWGRHCKSMKPGERGLKGVMAGFFAREKDLILAKLPTVYEARKKGIDYGKPKSSIEAWLRKADEEDWLDWGDEAESLAAAASPIMREALIRAFAETLRGLQESEVPIDAFVPRLNAWLDKRLATYPAEVCETTKAIADGIVRRALANGQSVEECAATISAQFQGMEGWRAATIARTEMNAVMNLGAVEGYRESGVIEKKQWVAALDERTRTWDAGDEFNHAIDEIVPIDEPFMGTGEPLDYPGAPGGSPGNVCNCRCTTIGVIEE